MKSLVIAIDGFSSTGKSTLAKQLAKALSYAYVDSGAMYRAVTLFAIQSKLTKDGKVEAEALIERLDRINIGFKLEDGKQRTLLNDVDVEDEIRGMEVSNLVSEISTISEVRRFLVEQQQNMAGSMGIVMDGRDIGTVVFPKADLKIFVTASPEIRAERRFAELQSKGVAATLAEVRANLEKRDHMDSTRADSPLRQADDARVLDNSLLNQEDQLAIAYSWTQELLK